MPCDGKPVKKRGRVTTSFAETSNSPSHVPNTLSTSPNYPAVAQGFIRDNLFSDDSDDPSFDAEFSDEESNECSLTDDTSYSGDEDIVKVGDGDNKDNGSDVHEKDDAVESNERNNTCGKGDDSRREESESPNLHHFNLPRKENMIDKAFVNQDGENIANKRNLTRFNSTSCGDIGKNVQDIFREIVSRHQDSTPLHKVVTSTSMYAARPREGVDFTDNTLLARDYSIDHIDQFPCAQQRVSQHHPSKCALHTLLPVLPDLDLSTFAQHKRSQDEKTNINGLHAKGVGSSLREPDPSQVELDTDGKEHGEVPRISLSEQERGPSLEAPEPSMIFLPPTNDTLANNVDEIPDDDDDPNDPDFQMPVPEVDLEEEDLDPTEARNADYVEFLTKIFIDNQTTNNMRSEQQGILVDASEHILQGPLVPDINAQDDDDDFDYLRESALVRDDPLEYRDDMTVPIKEVIQLLGETDNAPSLRPRTRGLRPRKMKARRSDVSAKAKPKISVGKAAPAHKLRLDFVDKNMASFRGNDFENTGNTQAFSDGFVEPVRGTTGTANIAHLNSSMAYMSLSPDKIFVFKQQLAAFVQIATHTHLEMARQLRGFDQCSQPDGTANKSTDDFPHISSAYNRSDAMLSRLVLYGSLSNKFHTLLSENLKRIPMRCDEASENGIMERPFAGGRVSIIDIDLINAVEYFMQTVSKQDWKGNDDAMKMLEKYKQSDIGIALRRRVSRPQSSNKLNGAPDWSSEDDFLLAMTIAKYGREFDENCRDLLPHRDVDDCQLRVRFLSSRRCPDNVVKRQMLLLNTPLTPEEIERVRYGLQHYGSESDFKTWKRIQRELLPGRDWSHLQKLWNWREKRRKYKAKYRAKLSAKRNRSNRVETQCAEKV